MNLQKTVNFIHNNYKKLILCISILLVASIIIFGASGMNRDVSANTHNEKYFKCISVERDDTLWSIAKEYMSEEYDSVEDYIAEVMEINGLTSDTLYNGASIIVPYYGVPM